VADRLERCDAQQEVRIRESRRQRLGLKVDAPARRVAPMQLELFEDPDEQVLEYANAFAIRTPRERQRVGARERLQEVRVLCHVDLELRAGEPARCNALHEGMLQAVVRELAIALPEISCAHGATRR
jgi:hypothetical protein